MNKSGIIDKTHEMRLFATALGIGLALVSTVFTVKLMITFGNNGFEKCLYAVFGALIQSAQTALYVYSAYCLWVLKEPGKALPGFLLFILLFCLSLAGSIGSFVVSNRSQNVGIEKTEKIKSTYDTELAAINKDAESVNKQLENLKAKGVVTKAKGTEEKSDALAGKRSALFEGKRQVIASELAEDPDALYKIIGEFFGITSNSAKMLLFTLYAIALELASVILLSYSMVLKGESSESSVISEPQKTTGKIGFQPTPPPVFSAAPAFAEKPPVMPPTPIEPDKPFKAEFQNPPVPDKAEKTISGFTSPLTDKKPLPVQDSDSSVQVHSTTRARGTSTENDKPLPVQDSDEKPLRVKGSDKEKVDADTLRAYIQTLFSRPKKDKSLMGRRNIADKLNISNEIADKIHIILKKKGFIRIEGNKSYPLMSENEMLVKV